jgi:hypothetical protein
MTGRRCYTRLCGRRDIMHVMVQQTACDLYCPRRPMELPASRYSSSEPAKSSSTTRRLLYELTNVLRNTKKDVPLGIRLQSTSIGRGLLDRTKHCHHQLLGLGGAKHGRPTFLLIAIIRRGGTNYRRLGRGEFSAQRSYFLLPNQLKSTMGFRWTYILLSEL